MRPALVFLTACLVILMLPNFASAQETPAPQQTLAVVPAPSDVNAADVLARAEDAVVNADRAMASVNMMLAFLQVAGLALTALLGAAAFVGLRSSQTLRADMEKAIEGMRVEMRDELQAMRRELDAAKQLAQAILDSAQAKLREFEVEADGELKKIKEYSDEATHTMSSFEQRVESAVNALTLVQLGKLQIENRNWASAQRTIQAAHDADPTNRAANYYLGELHIINRELDKAIELLKAAQPNGEIFPPAEAALAYALRLSGERKTDPDERDLLYAEAEQRYRKALKIEPGVRDIHDASVWAGLGALYRRQRRYEDSFRCYHEAEKVTPYNSYPLINLAILYLHRGDAEKAEQHFGTVVIISERRLESNPMDEWTRYDAITGNLGLGNGERAQGHLDYILNGNPSRGPMESFLSGLRFMCEADNAPTVAIDMLTEVEARLVELKAAEATQV
jgi:tetratricopeptide (TPR) repeat protein